MTEWWVSQKKHFCKICRVWTGGHIRQITKHEEGRLHIENKERGIKHNLLDKGGTTTMICDLKRSKYLFHGIFFDIISSLKGKNLFLVWAQMGISCILKAIFD
jgi:hypothetical protein